MSIFHYKVEKQSASKSLKANFSKTRTPKSTAQTVPQPYFYIEYRVIHLARAKNFPSKKTFLTPDTQGQERLVFRNIFRVNLMYDLYLKSDKHNLYREQSHRKYSD